MKKLILLSFLSLISFSKLNYDIKANVNIGSSELTVYKKIPTESNFKKSVGVGVEYGDKVLGGKSKFISPYFSAELSGNIRYEVKLFTALNAGYIHYLDDSNKTKLNLKYLIGVNYWDVAEFQISTSTTNLFTVGAGVRLGI